MPDILAAILFADAQLLEAVGKLGIGGGAAVFLLWLARHVVVVTIPGTVDKLILDRAAERDQRDKHMRDMMRLIVAGQTENRELHKEARHGVANFRHEWHMAHGIESEPPKGPSS